MATTKNITMKQFNGTDYDTLYPKTKVEQVEGAYTQQQILANSTKTLYGLDTTAVPDDAFNVLSRFNNGLGNEYLWEKSKQGWVVSQAKSATDIQANTQNRKKLRYSDSYTLGSDGSITLNNPVEVTPTTSNYASIPLAGKYFQETNWSTGVYETAVYYSKQNLVLIGIYVEAYGYLLSTTLNVVSYGYVNSPDPNAYPPTVPDGYTYTPLGQIGAKAQIKAGSYTGTGTYASNNKNILTFDFEPLLLIVDGGDTINLVQPHSLLYIKGAGGIYGTSGFNYQIIFSANGNTVSWYNSNSANDQLNNNGTTYHYIAIG